MSDVIAYDADLDALDEHLNGVWEQLQAEKDARAARRERDADIFLYDGDWVCRGSAAAYIDYSVSWKMNEVGSGTLVLPVDHYLSRWALDVEARQGAENIHMTVEKDGARWGGRCQKVALTKAADGTRTVTLTFLDDIKELEHIHVWSNPFLMAALQFPKSFVLAGPAKYMLKLTLFLNLIRLHGNFWHLPDDPLDISTWFEGVTPWDWSIAVAPGLFLMDDSQWCVIDSRFKNFLELAKPILADAGLMITTRRWLWGDEKPEGWILPLRNGQLIVDIIDKSGVYEQTATGGTIFGGMLRTVTTIADNLVDDVITTVMSPTEPAQYSVSKWMGTAPAQPWVVLRDGEVSPIESGSYTWQPATVVQINAGGRSAPGVNAALSLGVQFMGSLIGSAFAFGSLGAIADTALAPLYEDVVAAFGSVKSPARSMSLGWSHYHEGWATGGETAWALSGIVAIREALHESRSRSACTVKVSNHGPYLIGDRGQGHFFLGDRVGVLLEGMPRGAYNVAQVSALTLSASRDSAPGWDITTGDPRAAESPLARLLNQSKTVFAALKNLGVTA